MRRLVLVLAGLLIFTAAARAAETASPEWVPVQIKRLVLINDAPAVVLVDQPEERYLLMFIDFFMANAIRMGMLGPQLERPLTHDLMGIFLRHFGAEIAQIRITDLKDNTYYALISLQIDGGRTEFDARPSDALALAVRNESPIFAHADLLKPLEGDGGEGEGVPPIPEPEPEAEQPEGKT